MKTKSVFHLLILIASCSIGKLPASPLAETPDLVKKNAILDSYQNGDNQWFIDNIPFFECPDKDITDIYYYRWRNYRKNIQWNPRTDGWTIHEGGGYGITPCPLGHHIYEGRWLKNRAYMHDYILFWFKGQDSPRRYSSWLADSSYAHYLVDYDSSWTASLLNQLKSNYSAWETERFDAAKGLFKWVPDRDGMEASLAGFEQGESDKFQWNTVIYGGEGYRPSLNSYMIAEARAIAKIATLAKDTETAAAYQTKADTIKSRLLAELWSEEKSSSFTVAAATTDL